MKRRGRHPVASHHHVLVSSGFSAAEKNAQIENLGQTSAEPVLCDCFWVTHWENARSDRRPAGRLQYGTFRKPMNSFSGIQMWGETDQGA